MTREENIAWQAEQVRVRKLRAEIRGIAHAGGGRHSFKRRHGIRVYPGCKLYGGTH